MALSVQHEQFKLVSWFSLTEWHQMYRQIYSNDTINQRKAYERLLAWKARIHKVPVGVDCTLLILQVCLRDREWTPKIEAGELPLEYENDLRLMYSTTIMRFLNHITNIGQTKQTSLFQIAKQLKIPEWIVSLRHDAAHGHELPSIGILRTAINVLLAWIHEEYWAAEVEVISEQHVNEANISDMEEIKDTQAFIDLIELWSATNLYVHTDYKLVEDIPDTELQNALQDLHVYTSTLSENNKDQRRTDDVEDVKGNAKYTLIAARTILLNELSRYLNRTKLSSSIEMALLDMLLNNAIFFPNTDILSIFGTEEKENLFEQNHLPVGMIKFWQDILILLDEKQLLEPLVWRLLKLVEETHESAERGHLAALWIKAIVFGYIKVDLAQEIVRTLEGRLALQKKLPLKVLGAKVKAELNKIYPHFKNVLSLNLWSIIPHSLTDINFVSTFILNANRLFNKFIPALLTVVTPKINECKKGQLLTLMEIYTLKTHLEDCENSKETDIPFSVEDLREVIPEQSIQSNYKINDQNLSFPTIKDQTVRNCEWKLASENHHWNDCPIGLLPWQIGSLEFLEPLDTRLLNHNVSNLEFDIIPGILDIQNLRTKSQINWSKVLRKKRYKRKQEKNGSDVIVDRAIQIAKRPK